MTEEKPNTELETFGGISFEKADSLRKMLIARRTFLNLTQRDVAMKADVPQASISKWERQGYMSMRALDFLKMLKGYDIEPNDVAGMLGMLNHHNTEKSQRKLEVETIIAGLDVLSNDDLMSLIQIMRGWVRGKVVEADDVD